MRIFTAVRHSTDAQFYYGGLWSGNFYPALRQLGHDVVESQVDLLSASRFMDVPAEFTPKQKNVRGRITQAILDEVTRAHQTRPIDLFLSYFYNSHFDPAGFDRIRRLGIPTVNFYCNSIYQFSLVAEIARQVDFSWHPEREAGPLYLKVNANPVWVQMGADPDVYHPVANVRRQPKACFVGQRYCDRDRWLAALAAEGVPFDIFGSGWDPERERVPGNGDPDANSGPRPGSTSAYLTVLRQNLHRRGFAGGLVRTLRQGLYSLETRKLSSRLRRHAKGRAGEVSEVYSQYEVILSFSNVWADGRSGSALIPHVRLRDFEAPMCRTCYLTGHTDEIREFYEVGKEIDTYSTHEELVDKTKHYLKNPGGAERLREAGYVRAKRDHTWNRRFKELFTRIGLDSSISRTARIAR